MNVFGKYAQYYDLLYRDKNYAEEAQYVHELLQAYAPDSESLLELGCGTGVHACFLAEHGYRIHGIDVSQEMLKQAGEHLSTHFPQFASQITFQHDDIRNVRLQKQFDAAFSLFHVISYQTTHEHLQSVFQTVHDHLAPGGVCIFDFWYGPAVLTDKPVVRVKRLEDEHIHVTRIAEPVMHPVENIVEVNYDVVIEEKQTHHIERIHETHLMRYLFYTELEFMLKQAGLKILDHFKWMTQEQNLGDDTWYSVLIIQKDE